MIDFGRVKKMIYFPHAYKRRRDPRVIHVIETWGRDWKGNEDLGELLNHRFAFYSMARCQPYTDELWAECEEWTRRRVHLEQDFNRMMEKGSKVSK